jgi:CRP-like cAMP-binding protein
MSIEDDIALLAAVPTFSALGREPLRIVAIGAETRYVHEGEALFREGEPAEAGFVVQEGSFTLTSQRRRFEPLRVGRGALIDELALLAATNRSVTATANEPSTVLSVPRKLFLKMLEGYPAAAERLRRLIAERADRAMRDIEQVRPAFETPQKPR